MPRHVVARAAEIPPGSRKLVHVGERNIVIFNINGELFALSDKCPHRGGSLSKGKLTGLVESSAPGDYKYFNYAVSVEPGSRLVEGPYVAETFPVEVEGNYIVVETR